MMSKDTGDKKRCFFGQPSAKNNQGKKGGENLKKTKT